MTETVIQLEKTTGELMDILRSKPDAAAFVQENADELQNKTVPELLADLLERKQQAWRLPMATSFSTVLIHRHGIS